MDCYHAGGSLFYDDTSPAERDEAEERHAVRTGSRRYGSDYQRVYGMVIDITEDTVIMEFGNNKNCRIPMQKAAIAVVEKPEDAIAEKEDKK